MADSLRDYEEVRTPRAWLSTYWPQIWASSLLTITTIYAIQQRTPGGPVLVFLSLWMALLSLGYAIARHRRNYRLSDIFNWVGGLGGAIAFGLAAPEFLPISVLCLVDTVLYAVTLTGITRSNLRRSSLVMIGILIALLIHDNLPGTHWPPHLISPTEVQAYTVICVITLVIDILQRTGRFHDRIETTLADLHRSNHDLVETQHELRQRLVERTQLLEVSRAVGSTLDLSSLLLHMLTQLHSVIEYGRATVMLLRNDDLVEICTTGSLDRYNDRLSEFLSSTNYLNEIKKLESTALLPDLSKLLPHTHGSLMAVPLIVRGRFIGLLSIRHEVSNFYTQRDADLSMAFANQVAGMIDSAQLQEAAAGAMVVAERHRLARELHDSVSQSLFGVVLGTRTAREQIDRAPDAARSALLYSIDLASAALAQMRALIFTLRPETLERKGLLAALQSQIDLLQPHHGMRISLEAPHGEPDVSLDVKEALYRIAAEAMQNAIRHAACRSLTIHLDSRPSLRLDIIDDGHGFDSAKDYGNHIGLKTMRERANALGGVLHIDSAPGQGTHISAVFAHLGKGFTP